jgi:hypothetical protein
MKFQAPKSKLQRSSKFQDSKRSAAARLFGALRLEFLWSLPVFTAFRRGRAEAESEGGDFGFWSL